MRSELKLDVMNINVCWSHRKQQWPRRRSNKKKNKTKQKQNIRHYQNSVCCVVKLFFENFLTYWNNSAHCLTTGSLVLLYTELVINTFAWPLPKYTIAQHTTNIVLKHILYKYFCFYFNSIEPLLRYLFLGKLRLLRIFSQLSLQFENVIRFSFNVWKTIP